MLLQSVLGATLPKGAGVSFEPPDSAWAAREHTKPAVNAFMYKVREDTSSRVGSWVDERSTDGYVVGRRAPTRHYQIWYLVTAWAPRVEQEHMLLSAALAALALHDTIPPSQLTGVLADAGASVHLSVANPELQSAPSDIWSALGTPPRAALDLVVAATLVPAAVAELAPAVKQLDLGARTAPRPDQRGSVTERRTSAPSPVLDG